MMNRIKNERMNKKGQFLARDWVIALIIFSGLMGLIVLMVASQADTYGTPGIVDASVEEDFANLQDTADIAGTAFEAASEKGGLSVATSFGLIFNAGFTVISLVFNSVSLSTAWLASFGELVGIPTAVSAVLFAILISVIMVVLVFVIISTTTRRDF